MIKPPKILPDKFRSWLCMSNTLLFTVLLILIQSFYFYFYASSFINKLWTYVDYSYVGGDIFKALDVYSFRVTWRFYPNYLLILKLSGYLDKSSTGTLYAFPVFLSRAAIKNFAEQASLSFPYTYCITAIWTYIELVPT